MKNKKMFVLVLITAVTVLLTGCSQGNIDTLSDKDTTSEEIIGSESKKVHYHLILRYILNLYLQNLAHQLVLAYRFVD